MSLKVNVSCISCNIDKEISTNSYNRRYKNKDYKCRTCVQKEVWQNPELLEKHSNKIKNSEKYKNGIKNRKDINGVNNPRYGVTITEETRMKMSLSRTGKTGENATAWKGGKESLYKRVKSTVFKKYLWGYKVKERDKCCINCNSTKNLDSHHIKPFKQIYNELLEKMPEFETESEKMKWFLSQDEIVDKDLKNGICLCRECHKKVHQNWGSHNPK